MTISELRDKTNLLTGTNDTSLPEADFLLYINNAYERVVQLIMQTDGRWQWDDTNQSDLPIATATLTSGQQDYTLAVTHLEILRIEAKDTNGNWYQIQPLDQADLKGIALDEFMETDAEVISYYDILGSSIFLYPAPNYTQAASLKVYFQRPPVLFSSSDVSTGTKAPGFNSLYHGLLPLWAAYEYALANGQNQKLSPYLGEIQRMEDSLKHDYMLRHKDDPMKMRPARTYSR